MEELDFIRELPQASKNAGEPMALTISGWKHDLIEQELMSRGVVFMKNTRETGSEVVYGRNKEGTWVIETWRFSPTPHSVVLFDPKSNPK